jgi:acyl dehydratase
MTSTGAQTLVEPLTAEQIATLPLYEWDIAQIGDSAPPLTLEATAERIANYCLAVRNENPIYTDPGAASKGPFGGIVAPPAYLFKGAPMRRNEVMHALGYASPEEKGDRSTPYAKAFAEFQRPIRLGDEITSVVSLEEKYERRGNQFITWRIRAHNQHGEDVGTYSYTIIWRQGPREAKPAGAPAAAPPAPTDEPTVDAADRLPSIKKLETQESIDTYGELTRLRPRVGSSVHSDPSFAERTIFGGTANMGVATAAYCSELIEGAYGPAVLPRPGASLEYKGIRPIRPGFDLTLSGRVTARRSGAEDTEIRVVNQDGLLCGIALATVVLD